MKLSDIQKQSQFYADNYEFQEMVLEGDCTISGVETAYDGITNKLHTRIKIRKLKIHET